MAVAKMHVDAIVFTPRAGSTAPNASLFMDSEAANALSTKSPGGSLEAIGGGGSENLLLKQMQNLSGVSIPVNTPIAKKPDGSIIAADSDGADTQVIIGVAAAIIADSAMGNVSLIGPNVAGALTGLGFAPGDAIYLGKTGGYTNDLNTLVVGTDSYIRIGYADCAAGAASNVATDLIMFGEVLARP